MQKFASGHGREFGFGDFGLRLRVKVSD